MKLAIVVFAACASAPPPPPPTANQCVAVEPSCRTAVEKIRAFESLRDREITLTIGECDQQEWSLQTRQCVAGAHASTDLAACATKFNIAKTGIFRDHPSAASAMAALTKFKDQMCLCKDSACAQQVSEDMTKWGQEMAKDDRVPAKFSDEETKELTAVGEAMGHCMQKAMGGGTP